MDHVSKFAPLRNGEAHAPPIQHGNDRSALRAALENAERLQPRRVRDRRAEHAARVARRYDELQSAAATKEQRAAVEAAYERAAGERALQHHQRSDYSAPPRHEITAEGAKKVLAGLDELRWALYKRDTRRRRRMVSHWARDILRYLLNQARATGLVYPSHKRIAAALGCSERTVRTWLAFLRKHGFLSWQRRLKRTTDALGTVVVRQCSNAYRLALSGLAAIGARVLNVGMGKAGGKISREASHSAQPARDYDLAPPLMSELLGQERGVG